MGEGCGQGPLREVAAVFLRLGLTAFGGPAAHVALMQAELVERRRWVSRERFLDLVAAANLIPGPNSTELAIHLGYLRAGWPGLLVAGACFIVPAALSTAGLAWAYLRFGALPDAVAVLAAVKPVVFVIVADALWKFLRSSVRRTADGLLAAAALAAAALGAPELAVLLAGGLLAALRAGPARGVAAGLVAPLVVPLAAAAAPAAPATAAGLFWVFAKIGSVLFGSGYVLLAFLRAELVERLGWLTTPQLLDAIAAGQLTPGPLFSTATFVGWVAGGPAGAAAATAGIFLPAFVFVALSGPLVPRVRASPTARAFLEGVVLASLGLMALVTAQLGAEAFGSITQLLIGLAAAVLVIRSTVGPAWIVASAAAAGWALALLR
ncbi:MAG: chromate efflux transporter [Anaeromyxobacteraceae bacterium]